MPLNKLSVFVAGAFFGLALIVVPTFLIKEAAAAQTGQLRSLGPYQIMQHANTTATPGVFRVNQTTGYVSYCFIDGSGRSVTCTPETP